jgi:hypothetical protein
MKRTHETGAKDVVGFLLYSPIGNRHFFRVHDKNHPAEFTDYKITAEDIQIKLLSNFNSLVEYNDGTKALDYSSEVLGK